MYYFIGLKNEQAERYEIETYKTEAAKGTPVSPSDAYLKQIKCVKKFKKRVVEVEWEFKRFKCTATFIANNIIGLVRISDVNKAIEELEAQGAA